MTGERKSHPYLRVWVADIVQSCQEMTPRQFGAHVRMLLHAWDRGYCSADPGKLAAITGPVPEEEMLDVLDRWQRKTIDGVRGEVLVNGRLERERQVMIEQATARSAAAQKANAIRWGSQTDPSRIRDGSQTDPTPDTRLQIPDDREETPAVISSAPRKARAKPTDPIVWTSELSWAGITEADRAAWAIAYPAVDIDRDLVKADQYLRSNPAKAHKRKWRSFITRWFDRTQERGGNRTDLKPAPAKGAAHGFRANRSHIPPDCRPEDEYLFWDGGFPRIPNLYTDNDGNLRHGETRNIICPAKPKLKLTASANRSSVTNAGESHD